MIITCLKRFSEIKTTVQFTGANKIWPIYSSLIMLHSPLNLKRSPSSLRSTDLYIFDIIIFSSLYNLKMRGHSIVVAIQKVSHYPLPLLETLRKSIRIDYIAIATTFFQLYLVKS